MRPLQTALALMFVALFVGCSQPTSPTSPASVVGRWVSDSERRGCEQRHRSRGPRKGSPVQRQFGRNGYGHAVDASIGVRPYRGQWSSYPPGSVHSRNPAHRESGPQDGQRHLCVHCSQRRHANG